MRKKREYRTYAQKMRRADREAAYTVVALLIIVAAWIVGGFGLAGLDLQVASTPIWIIGGTVGTWAVAIVVAVVLARVVFADFDLADAAEGEQGPDGGARRSGDDVRG